MRCGMQVGLRGGDASKATLCQKPQRVEFAPKSDTTEFFFDTVIVVLVDSCRSEVRLASHEAPQKIPKSNLPSGDFHVHQSLQGPFLSVFVHLCRRPPAPCHPERSEGSAFRRCSGGSSDPPANGRERPSPSSRGHRC